MKSTIKLLAVAALLVACGDNKSVPDAGKRMDGPVADAMCSNCPAAPALGAQIDRMGRPAINTALNHGFEGASAAKEAAKTAYNTANPADTTMLAPFVPEFMKNLAVIDALDTGICGNAICERGEANVAGGTNVACPADCPATGQIGGICGNTVCEYGEANTATGTNIACPTDCPTANQVGTIPVNGCQNQVLYNGGMNAPPNAMSYQTLATVLVGDELYLDTSKAICAFYLAVEFGVAISQPNTTCGGRAPQYDVIDFTFSLGALGLKGFSTDGLFTPQFKDNAGPHTDYLPSFPYLGDPN